MSLNVTPDDAPVELTSGSFWEVNQYKRTVTRIDNGMKLCDDLMLFIKERATLEEQYSKLLKQWSSKFHKLVEKNSSYHTLQTTWLGMLNEADRTAQLHSNMKEQLMADPYEKVKQWKKENYHTLTLGGIKESKLLNEEFMRAQKQWAKYMKKVTDAKKTYFNVCKEERSAQTQENTAKSDASLAPEKVKKLQELVEKKGAEKSKYREKYEQAVRALKDDTPRYMEDMEKVFVKCQEFEEKRLEKFKAIFHAVHGHLDLSTNVEHKAIFVDLKSNIDSANSQNDLQWWRSTHGPDMPMNWPEVEDYDPERILMQKSMSRKQGSKASKHVAGMDGLAGAQFTSTYPATAPVETKTSGNGSANRPNSWSDDEQNNPFQDSSSEGNPFGSVENTSGGVPVRALYNYDGQEEDELTFLSGETLYKLEDEDEQGWCKGRLSTGKVGLYPANYVETI
ncbi:protein kinase C and casein kinase substrate in neurons protein 2 [Ciona intestinalis]